MLDNFAREALIAVPPEVLGGQVEGWFLVVQENLTDENGNQRSWDEFADAMRSSEAASSFGPAVDTLIEVMAPNSGAWPDIAAQLVHESAEELTAAYGEALDAAAAAGYEQQGEQGWADEAVAPQEPQAAQDPAQVWARLLADGGDWSGWNGSDEEWERWRDWFYSVAAPFGDDAAALARQRLEPLEGLSLADRVAGLKEQGFTLAQAEDALKAQQQEAQAAVGELMDVSIDSIIDGALSALNLASAVADDLKPLLRERLETAATSQPELFTQRTPAQMEELRAQLQTELEAELRSVLEAAS